MKISPLAGEALHFERRTDAEAFYFRNMKFLNGPHNYVIILTGMEFIIRLVEPQSRRTIGYISE